MKPKMQNSNRRAQKLTNHRSFRTSRSRINWGAKNFKNQNKKTTKGWFFYGFLWILWICVFLIAYFRHNEYLSYSQVLKNAFVIPSGIDFGMVLMWWAARSLIFSYLGFMFYKISEALKLRKLKRFLKMEPDDPLFDNMDSYNDYQEYLEIKKKNTKIAFWVGLSTFTVIFIITLVVALV